MKHRIVIRCEGRSLRDFALKQQISKCITAALAHQGVNTGRSTRRRMCCHFRCLN